MENIRVPILKLAHTTHNREAQCISQGNTCEFKARQKLGKPGTGSYRWNTDHFDHVDNKTVLLKGCYSWWTSYVHNYNVPDDHPNAEYCISPAKIKRDILDHSNVSVCVADFLKYPSECIYGNRIFSCDFVDLLDAYARSRNSEHLFVKIGGTLRYKHVSCYVLIICTDGDQDLSDIPPLTTKNNYIFESNGLTIEGRVINRQAIGNFHPHHIIQWAEDKSYCTAEAAFVFYFPEQALIVEHPKCEKATIDAHTEETCLRKVMGRCPNQL